MGFGDRLRQARNAAKLNGDTLGSRLGVSKQTISHWENGRYEPSLEQLLGLCAELGVSADWLLGLDNQALSADAVQEARVFDALSAEDKRRWRTIRTTMFATV
jgi:transcriptional regulator with XRE-family HTH domain